MSPLITPKELAELQQTGKLVVLDTSIEFRIPSEPEKDNENLIPNTVRFDYDSVFCDPDASLPHMMPSEAIRMEGQVSVFTYQDKAQPCYQCLSSLFGSAALSCVEAGVMAPVVGIIGAVQAMEAIKVIANYGRAKEGKVLILDAMTMSWREMNLMKMPNCPVCS